MKKIIALCGPERSGKTDTLNMVIEVLKGNTPCISSFYNEDRKESITYNGFNIAVTTEGDYSSYIEENFSFCRKNNCDILITSVREPFEKKGRSKKSPKEELEEQSKKHNININITYIDKPQEITASKQKPANLKYMTDIISKI